MFRRCVIVLVVASVVFLAASVQANVFNMGGTRDPATGVWTGQASLEFMPVGDPGNVVDTMVMNDGTTGYGSVPYVYQIGKYDVTVGQYCQFLNAVAKTDTYGLYNTKMVADMRTIKIIRSGSSGNFSYAITGGYNQAANCPIFDVSWGDAARFCNWLHNGQPTGAQGSGTTETGAYTLNGAVTDSDLMAVNRNSGAKYFIPSEDEWYKAAYYKGGGAVAGYWLYPTRSDNAPINTLPDTGNHANFWDYYGTGNGTFTDPTNYSTPVGAFSASPGPYETYDMGGDIFQWNEAAFNNGSSHGLRGCVWYGVSDGLASSYRNGDYPTFEHYGVGFRVACVPEPGSIIMLAGVVLTALLYGWRKNA
jgi:formylglycine-generating enzyme